MFRLTHTLGLKSHYLLLLSCVVLGNTKTVNKMFVIDDFIYRWNMVSLSHVILGIMKHCQVNVFSYDCDVMIRSLKSYLSHVVLGNMKHCQSNVFTYDCGFDRISQILLILSLSLSLSLCCTKKHETLSSEYLYLWLRGEEAILGCWAHLSLSWYNLKH